MAAELVEDRLSMQEDTLKLVANILEGGVPEVSVLPVALAHTLSLNLCSF